MKPIRKRTLYIYIVLAAVALVGFGGWYTTALPDNFAEVEAGVLYRSGKGRTNEFQNAIDRYHIKTIVCLRQIKPGKEFSWLEVGKSVAEKNHVNFVHWPMDSHDPLPEHYWIDFIKMTQDPAKTPILVHCAQGKHRTGFFVGLYRMAIDGWSFDQVWNEMQSFDFGDGHLEIVEKLKTINPEELRKKIEE